MWSSALKPILVVDNNIDPPHGSNDLVRSLQEAWAFLNGGAASGLRVEVRRGPEEQYDLDVSLWSGVVLSGSKTAATDQAPWISRQLELLRKLLAARVPTLGVCYGEQLMAKAFGGEDFVRRSTVGEFGFVKIIQEGDSSRPKSLFLGLPETFYSFCRHYDEVTKIPAGFRLTASSTDCEIHGLEHESAPMWGIQFHPERNLVETKESMAKIRSLDPTRTILGEAEADKLFDPRVTQVIFSNFLKAVRRP